MGRFTMQIPLFSEQASMGHSTKLTITSEDGIHRFFLPAFCTKQNAVPGRYATTWFNQPARNASPILHPVGRGGVRAAEAEGGAGELIEHAMWLGDKPGIAGAAQGNGTASRHTNWTTRPGEFRLHTTECVPI